MRLNRTIPAVVIALTLQGCTSYVYSGAAMYEDDKGIERCYGVQWSLTEYAWLYGVQNDPIDLRLAGGSDSIHYAETRDDGIVSRTEADETVADSFAGIDGPGVCGRVLNAEKIREIQPGPGALKLTFHCIIERDDFSVGPRLYLAARPEPYEFDISRMKTKDPQGDAPKTPACD